MTRSPAQIREAIAQARADLGAHLNALANPHLFEWGDGPGGKTMATQEKPKRSAEKAVKSAKTQEKPKRSAEKAVKSARTEKSKSSGGKSKKGTAAKIVEGAAATAGHALDTMAAGAVVGAVKAAAESLSEAEARKPRGKHKSSAGEVLGEMAPDAAAGAIAGAAQAIIPEAKPESSKAAKPAKAGAARKK